jgi:transcriptional regulator with XRE-family HTH domain
MTLEDYRIECGWSKNEMCRQASMDFNTLQKALSGKQVSITTAHKLARAVSSELGRPIRIQDIEGLNFR